MEQEKRVKRQKTEKKAWKFLSWETLGIVMAACVIQAIVWIGMHGVPLMGLPEKEEVSSITITHSDFGERELTGTEDIELMVKAANLLNYRVFGAKEGSPIITVTYHLKNGRDIRIEANHTTMWWHGKTHPIKDQDVFVNVIQGLYFEWKE